LSSIILKNNLRKFPRRPTAVLQPLQIRIASTAENIRTSSVNYLDYGRKSCSRWS